MRNPRRDLSEARKGDGSAVNINTLGLCKKSGKLVTGFDAVVEEMANEKSKIAGVLVASDISEKTLKELRFQSQRLGFSRPVIKIDATMDELERILRKRTGILAVLDEGFFKSFAANSSDNQSVQIKTL